MKTLKIGLLWQSPDSTNLGLAALAKSNIAVIKEEAANVGINVDFVLFSARTPDAEPDPEDRIVEKIFLSKRILSPGLMIAALRSLRSCDLVFDVGEGDSFSDIYGWQRFLKITIAKFMVAQPKDRLVLSPQTIGPFAHPIAKIMARIAMGRANRVYARDQMSFDRASAMLPASVRERLALSTDMAFALPIRTNLPDYFPEIDPARTHFGFNISGLLYRGGYNSSNQFGLAGDYRAIVEGVLTRLKEAGDCQIWLIPHVHNGAAQSIESDRAVSLEVASRFEQVQVAPPFLSATDAKTFISRMNFFAGGRMHATIAAVSTGVACVPMSYSPKFEGLYGSLGYQHVLALRSEGTEAAIAAIMDGFQRRDQLAQDAAAAADNARNRLKSYRSFVRDALMTADRRRGTS